MNETKIVTVIFNGGPMDKSRLDVALDKLPLDKGEFVVEWKPPFGELVKVMYYCPKKPEAGDILTIEWEKPIT